MLFHLTRSEDLTRDDIAQIYDIADKRRERFLLPSPSMTGKVLATIFFQPSTRTQIGFKSAYMKLGGNCISINSIEECRSGQSAREPIEDFARMVSSYCDHIVFRTLDAAQFDRFISAATVPVISGGNGALQHPTQALIDFYTICRLTQRQENLNILFIGNPKRRTSRSLTKIIDKYPHNTIHLLSPRSQVFSYDAEWGLKNTPVITYHSYSELIRSSVCKAIDVIYMEELYESNKTINQGVEDNAEYSLSEQRLSHFNKNAIILHALPRSSILPSKIDSHPSAKYFTQAQLGLYVRAGIIEYINSTTR